MIYKAIGKAVVKFGILFVRRRYGRQIRFALGFGLAALLIGGYLASREVPEG
jgi:hypothetical protein